MKLRKRMWALAAAAVLGSLSLLATTSTSVAALPAVIGNFEDQTLDGWGSVPGPGSPVYSQSTTTGVTLGSGALRATNPQNSFWGPNTGNLVLTNRQDLQDAQRLAFDLTLIGTELSGDGTPFSGFAQSNELAITLFSPNEGPGGGNLNLFIQKSFGGLAGAGVSDSLNQAAGWNGVDGTRRLTWDLTKFTANDPNTGTPKSVSQFLATYPGIVEAKIAFVAQAGGGSGTTTNFYFDNVVLSAIPEPTSLGLLGATGLMLVVRRRRSV
jgi:hypothetical protein